MLKRLSLFAGLLLALASPALAVCDHTGNTSGTDSAAVLATLTDICTQGGGGTGIGAVIGTKAAGTAATNSLLIGGVYNSSPPTLTNGQQAAAQVDSSGRLITAPVAIVKLNTSFTRPNNTTGYTANDAVNNDATAGGGSSTKLQWTIPGGYGRITRVRIRKSDQTVATPTLRLWFYDATFTMAAGDNEAFVHPVQDALPPVDVAVVNAGSDDAVGWTACDIPVTVATLYGQVQTLSAFTPAAQEVFTIDIWVDPR